MLILGLTGSIGMGKSTAAEHFNSRRIPVFDSDREVHRLYERDAVALIEEAFPGTTNAEGVDRARLSKALESDDGGFAKLNALIHPLVFQAQWKFLKDQFSHGAKIVVLEIPLLFETHGEEKVDFVIVVSADAESQKSRVLERPGMTEEKLKQILGQQMPDHEKRRRANYVVDTSGTIDHTCLQIDMIIDSLQNHQGKVFENWWRKNQEQGQI